MGVIKNSIREKINFHPNENKIPSEGKINLFRKDQDASLFVFSLEWNQAPFH